MYFPSKKDWWISAILWGAVLVTLNSFYRLAKLGSAGTSVIPIPLFVLIVLPAIILIPWLWFTTGYTVTDQELIVRGGPFRWRIDLKTIRKVRRTRNAISSPALSLDRLEIEHDKGYILISPANAEAFLNLLQERCPQADIKYE